MFKCKIMEGKEINYTSYDSQGPTDFDYVGFHLNTIKDIEKVFEIVGQEISEELIPSEKLDEISGYIQKLKRFIKQC